LPSIRTNTGADLLSHHASFSRTLRCRESGSKRFPNGLYVSKLHHCLLIENATSLPVKRPSYARQGHSLRRVTQRKADEQGAVRTCTPNAHSRAARSNGTVLPLTHEDRSVEIIWRTFTTREMKTIFSVASTCIKLVRYTERGRALDRACRLGEPKMDPPPSPPQGDHRQIGEGQGYLR
jgi:hypothetical protein